MNNLWDKDIMQTHLARDFSLILEEIVKEYIIRYTFAYIVVWQICHIHDLLLEHVEQVLYIVYLDHITCGRAITSQVLEAGLHHGHQLGAGKDHQGFLLISIHVASVEPTKIVHNVAVESAHIRIPHGIRGQWQLVRGRSMLLCVAALSENEMTCGNSKWLHCSSR